jgi:hypothetical protein
LEGHQGEDLSAYQWGLASKQLNIRQNHQPVKEGLALFAGLTGCLSPDIKATQDWSG